MSLSQYVIRTELTVIELKFRLTSVFFILQNDLSWQMGMYKSRAMIKHILLYVVLCICLRWCQFKTLETSYITYFVCEVHLCDFDELAMHDRIISLATLILLYHYEQNDINFWVEAVHYAAYLLPRQLSPHFPVLSTKHQRTDRL